MRLHFDEALVRRLLEHSEAATERSPTMDQTFDGRYRKDRTDVSLGEPELAAWPTAADVDGASLPAGCFLVGDEGVYLMSNGLPGLLEPGQATKHACAMSEETDRARNPDGWDEAKRAAFGGDDGVEFLAADFLRQALAMASLGRVALDVSPTRIGTAKPSAESPRRTPRCAAALKEREFRNGS